MPRSEVGEVDGFFSPRRLVARRARPCGTACAPEWRGGAWRSPRPRVGCGHEDAGAARPTRQAAGERHHASEKECAQPSHGAAAPSDKVQKATGRRRHPGVIIADGTSSGAPNASPPTVCRRVRPPFPRRGHVELCHAADERVAALPPPCDDRHASNNLSEDTCPTIQARRGPRALRGVAARGRCHRAVEPKIGPGSRS